MDYDIDDLEMRPPEREQRVTGETIDHEAREFAVRKFTPDAEEHRSTAITRVSHLVNYVFYLLYAVIAMEILLELMGANDAAGFKQFMDALTAPFLMPFRNLVVDPGVGPFRLMLSSAIALIAYATLHIAVRGLLRVVAHPKTPV